MVRTLISISERDKRWLDTYSRRHGQSAAETMREAIRRLREADARGNNDDLLAETAGIWRGRNGSADEFVDEIRNEW